MTKASTLQCPLLRLFVPLLLVASFTCVVSVVPTTEVSGNEVNTNGMPVHEELAQTNLQGHDEEEKFKGFFPKPIPIIKPVPKPIPIIKPIPIVKPIPKPIPVVKPIPIPVYKAIPKPVPVVKPIPIVKPIPNEEEKFKGFIPKPIPIVKPILKPIPVVKPIPIPVYKPVPKLVPIVKPIPVIKPVPKLIPIVKPIPKPFIVKKPIPGVESEEFLKPKPFFKKPIPKLPLHPKFEKLHFPIHKPIPTP